MRKSTAAILLISLAALSLGGCRSIFGFHRLRAADVALEGGVEVHAVGQLAAGRQALDAGNYAAAITAFSNVRTVPGFEGDAYNGLAIAYAGIGRHDLAETYFRRAVAVSPTNERFRRNLARFTSLEAERRAAAFAVNEGTPTVQQRQDTQRIAGLRISEPAGKVSRISANEVFIQSDLAAVMWEPVHRPYPVKVAITAGSGRQARTNGLPGPTYPARVRIEGGRISAGAR